MLDYKSPDTRQKWRPPLLRIAFLMGLLPLFAGMTDFLLWFVTRSDAFQFMGLFIIGAGLLCFAIGGVCLLIHAVDLWQTRRQRGHLKRDVVRSSMAAFLLLLNFPTCFAVIRVVSILESQYVINILNESSQPAHSVVVAHGSKTFQLGDILPRANATLKLVPEGAPLKISLTQNGKPRQSVPADYLYDDDNVGSSRSVTIVIDDDAIVAR